MIINNTAFAFTKGEGASQGTRNDAGIYSHTDALIN